jgi:hypothetical protein
MKLTGDIAVFVAEGQCQRVQGNPCHQPAGFGLG